MLLLKTASYQCHCSTWDGGKARLEWNMLGCPGTPVGNLLCKEFMAEPCCALCQLLSTSRSDTGARRLFLLKVNVCLLSIDNLVLTTKDYPFYLGCSVLGKTLLFWWIHQGARLRHINRRRENSKSFQMTWASRWLGNGHLPLLRTGNSYPRISQAATPVLNDQGKGVLSLELMKWL